MRNIVFFFVSFMNQDVHGKLTSTSNKEQTTQSATSSSTTFTPNGNEKKEHTKIRRR